MRTGVVPPSSHFSTGVVMSNWLVPTPPPQWNIPGTMKRRKNLVRRRPHLVHHLLVILHADLRVELRIGPPEVHQELPSVLLESRQIRSEEHTSELQSPCNLVCR